MIICTRRLSNETIPFRHPRIVHGPDASVWIIGYCDNIGYPPPPLNASLNSRTLDLRETASQLVVKTVEDALRAGGIALFDERFQIDSSLDWVIGEAVSGELEAVVPLWSRDGHVVFTQPGFVLWNGLADDNRLDGNLGVVYRTNLLNTPVGFDAIGGVSLFYDHDFQIGHSRLGIGVDVQRDGLHGAFNYYHPLSDTQDGREGYVEDALQGMDASLAVESDVTRVGGNVGYWLFQGDEDVKDEWEFSYGLDAGLRLMPGVFLEGRLESHDKASLGRRASVGLAFRFNLPNFDGKSYGEGVRVSNLWSPVDRESRILYEERESGPTVSLSASSMEITEGGMATLTLTLNEMLEADATFNLIGSGGAEYGASADWNLSVGGTDCDMATRSNPCQVTIDAGDTTAEVVVEVNADSTNESSPETFTVSVEVDSGSTSIVQEGSRSSLNFTIPADPPLPTVSLSADTTSITEGGMATLTLTLNEMLEADATFNLIGSGEAEYGTSADWNLSVGGTDCAMATNTNPCQVTITAGQTSAEVTVKANADMDVESTAEDAVVTIQVDSGSTSIVALGSPTTLRFTIQDDPPPTVSLNYSGSTTISSSGDNRMTIELSEALTQNVTVILTPGGTASFANSGTGIWGLLYHVLQAGTTTPPAMFPRTTAIECSPSQATSVGCRIEIPAGRTVVDLNAPAEVLSSGDTIELTLTVDSMSSNHVTTGTPSFLRLTAR